VKRYVYLRWTTPDGRARRGFAYVIDGWRRAGRRLVSYKLVDLEGDERSSGEVLIAFADDVSVTVTPARFNNVYATLERVS
jgi:hypothetical protein